MRNEKGANAMLARVFAVLVVLGCFRVVPARAHAEALSGEPAQAATAPTPPTSPIVECPSPYVPPVREPPGAAKPSDPDDEEASLENDPCLARECYELAVRRPDDLYSLMKKVLATYMENPDTVEMAFAPSSPFERLAGRFKRIEIALRSTKIKKLGLDYGFIVLEDVVIDLPRLVRDHKFRFREKGRTEFLFVVSEEALNGLLKEKGSKLKVKNARLTLDDGHLNFSGRMRVLFFNNHVSVTGRLTPRHGTQIHFDTRALRLDFLPIPGFVRDILERKINPVADLKDFRFNVDLGLIRATPTRLMLGSRDMNEIVLGEAQKEREGRLEDAPLWPPPGHATLLVPRPSPRPKPEPKSPAAGS